MPIAALRKKQCSVSHSTPEAEIVAVDHSIHKIGVPSLDLWETILQRKNMQVKFHDNSACVQIMKTGKCETTRHIQRTHNICIKYLHEQFTRKTFLIDYTPTDSMCRYFHKSFYHACQMVPCLCADWYHQPSPALGKDFPGNK